MQNELFFNFTDLQVTLLESHILQVKLNRPELHNAISANMWQELKELWQYLYVDSGNIRCIILTGAGNKAFSAGADLKERNGLDTKTWLKQHSILEQSMRAMMDCPLPIIAAINGLAYGGGLELVLACDFAYSVESAKFAFPEPKIGIIPGALGTQLLPRVCGIKIAKEMCIGGKVLDAIEAKEYGLVNKILTSHDELQAAVLECAKRIVANSPRAVRQVKKSLNATLNNGLDSGYRFEIEAYNSLIEQPDRFEGIQAFNEKRIPIFVD